MLPELKVTGRRELASALKETVPVPSCRLAGPSKAMVCAVVVTTGHAGAERALLLKAAAQSCAELPAVQSAMISRSAAGT